MNKERNKGQDEVIKKENRKALKLFIPILIVSTIVGGVIGFFSATNGIQNFGEPAAGLCPSCCIFFHPMV